MFSNEHQTLEKKVIFLKKLWVEDEMTFSRGRSVLPISCINIIILVCWEVSLGGWYKLNTDGASRSPSNYVGECGLFRDSIGLWLGGFCL